MYSHIWLKASRLFSPTKLYNQQNWFWSDSMDMQPVRSKKHSPKFKPLFTYSLHRGHNGIRVRCWTLIRGFWIWSLVRSRCRCFCSQTETLASNRRWKNTENMKNTSFHLVAPRWPSLIILSLGITKSAPWEPPHKEWILYRCLGRQRQERSTQTTCGDTRNSYKYFMSYDHCITLH
jgi:hypothetical protein